MLSISDIAGLVMASVERPRARLADVTESARTLAISSSS